ncbi:MAG: FAD-binding oxidoreductase, partial [Dehalococcoidia bacterium]
IIFDYAQEYFKANKIGIHEALKDQSRFNTLRACYGKTVDQIINPVVFNEKVRAVFTQMWEYPCLPPAKCSFDIYAMMMAAYHTFGQGIIRGTSQALSQAFVDAIEDSGGEVWLNNGAKKILTDGERVNGVITGDGTEVSAQHVVCSSNPVSTCLDLIGADRLPEWYLRRLNAWTNGASFLVVYMGLDCTHDSLGITAYENFINLGYDMNHQYELYAQSPLVQPDSVCFTTYNVADEFASPPGTSSLSIAMLNYVEPWLKLSGKEYIKAKNKMANSLIGLIESRVPGIRDHIEILEVATPLTIMRYTNNPGGSIVGFDETFQVTGQRPLPSRGPIKGLYFSNAWVNKGGGFEPCIVTGQLAAMDILQDMENDSGNTNKIEKLKVSYEGKFSSVPVPDKHSRQAEQRMLKKNHSNIISLSVQDIIEETTSTKTLRLQGVDGKLPYFRAGQYLSLAVNINGVVTNRPYSISSTPGKPYYDITVRRMQRGFVSSFLLDNVKKGDLLQASVPYGNFYYEPVFDTRNLVLLAGGSGITPFMSMLRESVSERSNLKMHLLYGSRLIEDVIFKSELESMDKRNSNITVDFIMSEPSKNWEGQCGFLDAGVIGKLVGTIGDKTFLICGPAEMYGLCEESLLSLGVKPRRIRKEVYGPPHDISQEPGWPGHSLSAVFNVLEERSGKQFQALTSEPLLVAMEKAALTIPSVCRSGECTACRTKLSRGEVFSPARIRRRCIDERSNYIHPCMSYPISDLSIKL